MQAHILGDGLYNGNISAMMTGLKPTNAYNYNHNVSSYSYQYDQLHRIKQGSNYDWDNVSGFSRNPFNGIDASYDTKYDYDADGNLMGLHRAGNGAGMDDLSYIYDTSYPNQLKEVSDIANSSNFNEDIDGTHAYRYDLIGNLILNSTEGTSVDWDSYNKVSHTNSSSLSVDYLYDAGGNRVAKIEDNLVSKNYVRDASGNVLSIYEVGLSQEERLASTSIIQREAHLYGSSRLGVHHLNRIASDAPPQRIDTKWTPSDTRYEINNHLGNVLSTISARKWRREFLAKVAAPNNNYYYIPEQIAEQDYYPFGEIMPGRSYTNTDFVGTNDHRYGFNGKERDDDREFGRLTHYDYGFRIYNSSIGKFLSTDPLADHPNQVDKSPYAYAWNNPVNLTDSDGRCPDCPDEVYVPLADHVYTAQVGDVTSNGWEAVRIDQNDKTGYQGALYKGAADSGFEGEYIYSTAGTEFTSAKDWANNFGQAMGKSKQYSQSIGIANQLVNSGDYEGVSFTGHSLGGGLASANALSTEGKAVTFNAAGLSGATMKRFGLSGNSANINAYIVTGEILDGLQRNIGLGATANHKVYLPGVGKNAVDKHLMPNVKAAFSIYQDIMSKPHGTFNYRL